MTSDQSNKSVEYFHEEEKNETQKLHYFIQAANLAIIFYINKEFGASESLKIKHSLFMLVASFFIGILSRLIYIKCMQVGFIKSLSPKLFSIADDLERQFKKIQRLPDEDWTSEIKEHQKDVENLRGKAKLFSKIVTPVDITINVLYRILNFLFVIAFIYGVSLIIVYIYMNNAVVVK